MHLIQRRLRQIEPSTMRPTARPVAVPKRPTVPLLPILRVRGKPRRTTLPLRAAMMAVVMFRHASQTTTQPPPLASSLANLSPSAQEAFADRTPEPINVASNPYPMPS